jgi:predicted Zn finger-like uncharacterized protein
MSLITTCPACGTMFRVVADQLRVSEGWVRCGHCAEVFDGTSHMAQESDPLPEADPAAAGIPAPVEPASQDDPIPSDLSASPLDAPFVFRRSDLAVDSQVDSGLAEMPPRDPMPEDSVDPSLPADSTVMHEVGFVRDARRKAFWTRSPVRILLVLAFLLLAGALAGQVAYQQRDRLAAEQPALKPALQAACEAIGCTLQAPRQIDTLAIDASSFNKLRGDAFRLVFTVKNNAPMDVAVPAMELTLTDSQDQPVLRRVLLPAELGAGRSIAAGGDWSASVALAVNGSGAGPQASRIAGYRLLAFYP